MTSETSRAGATGALGTGLTLLSASLFALNTPTARGFVYAEGGEPITLLMARTGTMAVVALLFFLLVRRAPHVPKGSRLGILFLTATLFIQGVGYLGSVAFIPVGLAAILFFTWPLMVAVANPLIGGARPTPLAFTAFALAFGGLALAVGPSVNSLDWRGIALVMMGALGLTAYLLAARHMLGRDVSEMTVAFYSNLGVVLACAATLPFFADAGLPTTQTGMIGVGAVCAFYVGAFLSQLLALKITDAATVAILFNLEPLISIAFGALVLYEVLSPNQYAGGALVLGALFLYSLTQRRPVQRSKPLQR